MADRSGAFPGKFLAGLAGLMVGGVLAVIAAGLYIRGGVTDGELHEGWRGNPNVGSSAADIFTRARIAQGGLLALRKEETIYFVRDTDDEGRRLSDACQYEISIAELPARWWSVTAYTETGWLPKNDGGPYSVDATRMEGFSPPFTAIVAPEPPDEGHWINSRASGAFNLTLRLYNPTPGAVSDFARIDYPSVRQIGCEGGDG